MHGGPGTLLAMVVYALGGFSAGLLFYMRICNRMPSGPAKHILGRGALFGLSVAGAAAAAWIGWTAWAWIPVLIVGIHLYTEMVGARKRRAYQGEPPVELVAEPPAGRWLTTRALRVLRYEFPGPWPESGRLRIGHISDLHIGPESHGPYLQSVAKKMMDAEPDLIVVAGDVVNRDACGPNLDAFLSALHAPLGLFASLGNHDYAVGAEAVREQLQAHGIHVLHGRPVTVRTELGLLGLVGDDRPWGESRPPDNAWPQGIPWVGLSHSPDNAFDFAEAGAFATFSGHLHAGQIRFPGVGPAALPSRNSRCFEHGHYRIGAMHLFVSAGIGNTFPSFRFRCCPDILLIDWVGPAAATTDPARTASGG